MSIIKKIAKIYIIMTSVILIAFIAIILAYTSIYDQSELSRIKGITSGEVRSFNNKISNLESKGEDFLDWIDEVQQVSDKYNIENPTDVFNLREKIETGDFDCVSILDEKYQTISKEEYIKIGMDEYENLLESLKRDEIDGETFVPSKEGFYYVYLKQIPSNEKSFNLLLIKEIDNEFINGIDSGIGRTITIEKEIEEKNLIEISLTDNRKAYVYMGKKEVKSYIPTKSGEFGEQFYFSINETRKATANLMEFSINIIGIFIVVFCFGNLIIYKIIRGKLIHRILKINNSVNEIIKNDEMKLLEVDAHEDEISNLSKDINKLLINLQEDNEKISIKERNNSRLLSAMQNLYVYIELIEDENGQVVDGIIKEMNKSALELFDINEELLGRKLSYYKEIGRYKYYTEESVDTLINIKEKGQSIIYKNYKLDENLYFDININCVNDKYISIILNNVSEINQINNKLEKLVNFDDVTGLYSKFYILDYLKKIIKFENEVFTILLDLDNFKTINDAIGHTKGDKILKILGESLGKLNNDKIIVGRFGGDEFAIIGIGNKKDAEKICKEVTRIINRRLRFNNYSYEVKATLGVSLYPSQGIDAEQLIQYADIAMHIGKVEGKNRYKMYLDEMVEIYEVEGRLKNAIARGELEAYFQPIYNTLSNEVIGAEALVRWRTVKEVITPDRFLEVAKKNGDIVLIDDLILREGCKLCKEKIEEGIEDFYISVNISYKYFMLDSFIEIVKEVIKGTGIKASGLRLEITELELLSDYDNLSKKLEQLRKIGVKISLDDFGAGYSAFNYIRKLPIDIVKIDNNLVAELGKDDKNKYIIDMIIKLCRQLNLEVVCEGVELKEQLDILKDINCENIQGYYISEPVNKEIFNTLLKNRESK